MVTLQGTISLKGIRFVAWKQKGNDWGEEKDEFLIEDCNCGLLIADC